MSKFGKEDRQMANKNIKVSSTSLGIRKGDIAIHLLEYLRKILKGGNIKHWQECVGKRITHALMAEM